MLPSGTGTATVSLGRTSPPRRLVGGGVRRSRASHRRARRRLDECRNSSLAPWNLRRRPATSSCPGQRHPAALQSAAMTGGPSRTAISGRRRHRIGPGRSAAADVGRRRTACTSCSRRHRPAARHEAATPNRPTKLAPVYTATGPPGRANAISTSGDAPHVLAEATAAGRRPRAGTFSRASIARILGRPGAHRAIDADWEARRSGGDLRERNSSAKYRRTSESISYHDARWAASPSLLEDDHESPAWRRHHYPSSLNPVAYTSTAARFRPCWCRAHAESWSLFNASQQDHHQRQPVSTCRPR